MADPVLVRRQLNAVVMNANRELAKNADLLSATPLDSPSLAASLAKLNSYHSRVCEYSEVILASLTDEIAIDAEIAKAEALKVRLTEAIAKINLALHKLDREETESIHSSNNGIVVTGDQSRAVSGATVKLPKLEIAKFAGDPMKFQDFWDTFENTIHNNQKLSSVEKFKYLRSYLDGTALVLADGYILTNANYGSVIEVLNKRYGDPEMAIFCHLDALLAVPMARTQVQEIQKVYDDCECHIRSLVGLGMPEKTFGRVFVPILLSKMPTEVQVNLHQKQGTGVCWTLMELREMIRTEIYARQMGGRSIGNCKSYHQNGSHSNDTMTFKLGKQKSWINRPPTASTLTVPSQGRRQARCRFCNGEHFSDKCQKHPDLVSRKKALGNGCFSCLRKGHSSVDCRSRQPCYYCERETHHRNLCPKQFGKVRKIETAPYADAKVSSGPIEAEVHTNIVTRGKRGVLQTALADVAGHKTAIKARLLLDIGSDNSFATNGFLKTIGAHSKGTDVVGLAGFQSTKRSLVSSPVHQICLSLRNGKQLKMDVYGTDVITCPIKKHHVDTSRNPVLPQVPLAEPISDRQSSGDIDILVGSDYYYDIVKTERIPLEGGLLLLDSELGYVLAGRTEAENKSGVTMLASLSRSQLPDSNFDLEKFWRFEYIGVHDPPEFCGDETALAEFNKTVVFDDTENRYQVKWPWKEEEPELSDNLKLSLGRLKSLLKRIEDKEEILDKYQSTIEDQVKLKIIEEAPKVPDGKVVHYIPHHGVVTPSKSTTKLRIVYDASCRASKDSQSLNDCLYWGPVMLKDLCGLLIRFRLSSVGIVSDLEKAFLQIGLQAPDRDAAKFLWVRDVRQPCSTQNLIHYRFRRVCFGVVSSPFLLAATVEHHLAKNDSEVARLISDNIYVDNVIVGKNSTEEAADFYKDAKAIFGKASMNLREIFSNDADFMESIPEIDRGKGCSTKVLGLVWDTKRDSLCVQVGGGFPGINSAPVTKRTVLRHIAQVFDPCGLLSPVTTVGKMLMQEVWKKKYDWDDALPDDLVKQWNNLHNELQQIAVVRIPRYIGESASLKAGRVDLHCFTDASSKAYCAAVYLRVVTECGFSVSLLFSKSRVAPVKTETIPRLELLAAYIGVKLLNFVKTELRLPVARMFLWSDSQCALQWIRNSTVSTTFVKNRIRQIKEIPGIEFRYVPNADNPADYPTRGKLHKNCRLLSSGGTGLHGCPRRRKIGRRFFLFHLRRDVKKLLQP